MCVGCVVFTDMKLGILSWPWLGCVQLLPLFRKPSPWQHMGLGVLPPLSAVIH